MMLHHKVLRTVCCLLYFEQLKDHQFEDLICQVVDAGILRTPHWWLSVEMVQMHLKHLMGWGTALKDLKRNF